MNIVKIIKDIKEGKKIFCNGKRITFENGKFYTSTISMRKSHSEKEIEIYIARHINTLECY